MHQAAIVYEHSLTHNPLCPSCLPSLPPSHPPCPLFSSVLPSRLTLVFHAGTSGAQGPQPAGFLARRSSSSAFCFHQWTTILYFCCVSKYLLAFLFLTAPTDVGVFCPLCVCVCVCFPCVCTHRILPNTYIDIHHLLLPCIWYCPSHNSAIPPPYLFFFYIYLTLSLHLPSTLSFSVPHLPSIMNLFNSCGRKERRKLLQFSPALSLSTPSP